MVVLRIWNTSASVFIPFAGMAGGCSSFSFSFFFFTFLGCRGDMLVTLVTVSPELQSTGPKVRGKWREWREKNLDLHLCGLHEDSGLCWFSWVLFHVLSQKQSFATKLYKKRFKIKYVCNLQINHILCKLRVGLKQFLSLPAPLWTHPKTTICFYTKINMIWFKTSRKWNCSAWLLRTNSKLPRRKTTKKEMGMIF